MLGASQHSLARRWPVTCGVAFEMARLAFVDVIKCVNMRCVLRTFAILLLAVVVTGVPMLACFVPDAQLTAEERDCCKQMADKCGTSPMPSSHSCCKTIVRGGDDMRVEAAASTSPAMVLVGITSTFDDVAAIHFSLTPIASSPPESPPAAISVLRI